jgi:xanthine dehydrogenase accessory factor
VKIVVEYVRAVPHLLIAGGGHCGLEVAKLCDQLGWHYTVLDDRPEFCSKERFPLARRGICATPDEFRREDLAPYTHVLLLGYSHKVDTDLLYDLVPRFPGWIGVISSRSKRLEMFRRLRARGIPEEALQRVVAPVGLAIGAETPAEIAVSICGQILAHWKEAEVREPAPSEEEIGK